MNEINLELKLKLEKELEPGEKVLWKESPIKQFFTKKAVGACLFSIPWTAFAVFWTFGAAGFKIPNFDNPGDLFPLFGVPFILIGLGLFSTPIWEYLKASKSLYVITDERAIIFLGGKSTTIRSYTSDKLNFVYRKERKGNTGDVIITVKQWLDSDDDKQTEELGFINIHNPKKVETLLKSIAEKENSITRNWS